MATPPRGTKLSLGKLGRATAVGNSDNTSKTSLNESGRDSSTSKTKISDFFIGSVDNSLTGNQYVDEQTNEIYTMTFGDENSLFQTRIASRHQNFTWTTGDSDLFALQSNQDFTGQFNAGAIAEAATDGVGRISKSFEDNLVTDFDFNAWADGNTLNNWYESGGSVISKNSITTSPSSSNDFAVKFDTQDGFITQSFNIKGNSTYEIVAHTSASSTGQIDLEISGAYAQVSFSAIQGELGEWYKFTNDFYSSGSTNTSHEVKLKFIAVSAPEDDKPLLDSVFFRRWEGSNFSDTEVEISGKYHDAGQSDGFNDHATRYNTAITKTVEIQDTYGGVAIACFLPDTKVKMADGSEKNMEDINIGDDVMTVIIPNLPDEDLGYGIWKTWETTDDMGNLEVTSAKVENMFFNYKESYWNINDGFLKVTSEHPLYVKNGETWSWKTPVEIEKSMSGNTIELLNNNGTTTTISTLEKVVGEVEVVNIDVEPLDVYFAGGVLVHNKGTNSDPDA